MTMMMPQQYPPTYPQTLYPHDLPIPTYYVLKMITYMAFYATPNPYYA